MQNKALVVLVVAGLLVVGYAFYTLLEPSAPRPERAGRSRGDASAGAGERDDDDEVEPRARRERPTARRPARAAALPTDADQARPMPGAPPRPTPEISLPEARKRVAAVMAELEALEQRGARLTSPEWVDLYKRGNDALLPLQQHLDWSIPEHAEELRRANEDLRAKLRVLEPRPEPVAPTAPTP